jgi:leader peptidase (prepilin peptidase)/N-methyltransferase
VLGPAAFAFCAGAIAGSFVTVVAHRLPRGESFVAGRSRCPGCGAQIAAYDNVPIFSWLALRGRCRNCGQRISARYPLTEITLAALYAGTVLALDTDDAGELALGLVLCTLLVTVTLTDLDLRLIPNRVVGPGALAGLALVAATDLGSLDESLLAGAIAGGLMFALALAYPKGMGMGDAKLMAMMGIYLGRAVAPAALVGFATGALVGLVLVARSAGPRRGRAIPFGPFLAFGGVIGLWFGDAMVDWYTDEFFPSG